ncbi:MAG: hypothetical protein Q9219_005894 [cf. Caloplaca sp. 3 TL-2023]
MVAFRVVEHTISGQHIREYPYATRSGHEEPITLAVKQYIPLSNLEPGVNDVTIIMGHANGFPKHVGSIIHEISSISSIPSGLRDLSLGSDTAWAPSNCETSALLPRFSSNCLHVLKSANLSIIHPRLFTSLILIEPIILKGPPPGPNVGMPSTFRQDLWPNRSAAETAFRKNKLFASFRPEVLQKYLMYGLRELPTAIYPDLPTRSTDHQSLPVTLTTTKHQEVWTFVRSNFTPRDDSSDERISAKDRLLNPSADNALEAQLLFGRPECAVTYDNLPHLRPATYFIFGGKSPFSPADASADKVARTGIGVGGSGGTKDGKVESYTFETDGHFLPFTKVEEVAALVATWMGKSLQKAREEDRFWKDYDGQKSERDRLVLSEKWKELVKQPMDRKRPVRSKL